MIANIRTTTVRSTSASRTYAGLPSLEGVNDLRDRVKTMQPLIIGAIALAAFCTAGAAMAVELYVMEEQFTEGPIVAEITIHDVLAETPKPHLNVHPDSSAQHQHLIDVLSAGIPFDDEQSRDRTAEVLAGYPNVCKSRLTVGLLVGPISHITRFLPEVIDKRRITGVVISGCLEKAPPKCEYDMHQEGEINFDFRSFLTVIKECSEATRRALQSGAVPLAVEDADPVQLPATSPRTPYVRYSRTDQMDGFSVVADGVLRRRESDWARADSPTFLKWEQAHQFCQSLVLSGGGWRLPSMHELAGLYGAHLYTPCGNRHCGVSSLFKLRSDVWWAYRVDARLGDDTEAVVIQPPWRPLLDPGRQPTVCGDELCWPLELVAKEKNVPHSLGFAVRLSFPPSFKYAGTDGARALCIRQAKIANSQQ